MQTRQMKIIDGSPTAAIYARKSKATEKGESIENQISRCISLCDLRGWGYVVFQDYDVSGATLDRPDFELMMKKIYEGEFQYLVCYKLDRVSRSTSDFSNLINELDSINVPFISIKENFDLTTPMGRAMMMITAVFAQLERETIAERVRDNMIDRAKLGKWNGGPVPYGFDVKKDTIQYKDRKKKVSKLIINKEESKKIKEFYSWYLAPGGSIRSVVTKVNELGYKTKSGAYWSHNQMSRILQNPLYCIADEDSYNYFKNNTEVNIVDEKEKFDGTHGLMYYNRRKPHKKTTREREEEDWILAIGEHKSIVSGEMYRNVQNKLSINKNRAPREGQSERSPLAGLVRCGRCGAAMSVFSSPKSNNKSKGYYNYFRCLTREQKAKILCDNSNVRADILEDLVLSHITDLVNNKKSLQGILEATNNDIEDIRVPLIAKRNKLQSELDNLDVEINNLVEALGKNILPELVIKRKYKELENRKVELRNELEKISIELNNNYVESYDLDTVMKHIENFDSTYEYLDFDEKKKLLNSIVKEIVIDKNKVKLTLYFLPGKDFQELDSQAFCSCTDMLVLAKSKTITLDCIIDDVEALPESTLGDRVKKLRVSNNNTTIKDLAKLCNLSPDTISNIEKNRTIPNINTINKISQALDTTNEYLLDTNSLPETSPAQIIYKYRMIAGLSQRQLAKKCGLHNTTIRDYENGRLFIKDTIGKIYTVLGYHKK